MDIFLMILEAILIAVLFIIPAILLDTWLANVGIVRADKTSIIIVTFLAVFTKQVLFRTVSWWAYGLLLVAALTLGVHRQDFTQTLRHGKWWWKEKERKNKPSKGKQ